MTLDTSLIAFKKLFNKPHTSDDKPLLANESLFVGFPSSTTFIFGESLPETIPTNFYTPDVGNIVEKVTLTGTFVPGTDTAEGYHGFSFKLPDNYESLTTNTRAGTFPYVNGQALFSTTGTLQIVSPFFGSGYSTELRDSTGNIIPQLDSREWFLYEFGGLIYQQTPPGTGDHASNPKFLDCYIYIGAMAYATSGGGGGGGTITNVSGTNLGTGALVFSGTTGTTAKVLSFFTVVGENGVGVSNSGSYLVITGTSGSSGSGGGADVLASYVVLGLTSSLPNERVLSPGNLMSITDNGAGGSVVIDSTLPANILSRIPDISASYILVGTTASLPNERALAGGSGITLTDGGAGSAITVSNDLISPFNSFVSASFVTLGTNATAPNERVLAAGDGISITDNGAGNSVVIAVASASVYADQFADISASYIVFSTTSSLPNERKIIAGPGVVMSDGGVGSNLVFSTPFVSSAFVTLSTTASLPNERVLTAGDGISITDGGPDGAVTISVLSASAYETQFADISASFIVFSTTASLPNERRFNAGPGLHLSDGGPGENLTVSAPFVSSSFITISTTASLPNERILSAGDGITITDNGANNSVVISVASASVYAEQFADISASFITIGNTSSLPNERKITAGPGINFGDGGANGNFVISTPFVSSTFIVLSSTSSLPNERVLTAGDGIALVDGGANGNLIISATLGVGQFADISASFITVGNTSSLPNERKLTAGLGIALVDEGAGGNMIVSSAFNVSSAFVVVGGVGNYPGQRTLTAGGGISITDLGAGSNVIITATSASITASISMSNVGSGSGYVYSGSIEGELGGPSQFHFFSVSGSGGVEVYNSGNILFISSANTQDRIANSLAVLNGASAVAVSASNAPVAGFVLVAESATKASWQNVLAAVSGGGVTTSRQSIAAFNTTIATSSNPQVGGGVQFVPSQHFTNLCVMKTLICVSTGSNTMFVSLYNITSGSYVHLGGPGIIWLSSSNTTPEIKTSVHLLSASNFSPSDPAVYEIRYYTASGSTGFHYSSEFVCS